MHMMRLIIEMESRFTPQSVMNPTTPISIETIEKATQREQIGFGIIMRETIIIQIAATATHWIVVGITIKNCGRGKARSLLPHAQLCKFLPKNRD